MEQLLFKSGKGDLELVLLFNQLVTGLLEVWLLEPDNLSEQLVFETRLSNNEVDDSALSCNLGLVVRVLHLRLQIKFEGWRDLDIVSAQFYVLILSLLCEGS